MDVLSALRIFVRVAERMSFSAVAREQGVGQPSISKQIAALETEFGAELLRRSSKRVALTDAGRELYRYASSMLDEFDTATSKLQRIQSRPTGAVRLALPPAFGRRYVVPALPAFFREYPGVNVEISAFEGTSNFSEQATDLALHSGDLESSNLFVKRIAETSLVTVATTAFLRDHGSLQTPHDLVLVPRIAYMQQGKPKEWQFRIADDTFTLPGGGTFRTSDADQMRVAVLQHMGVAQGPRWLFAKEVEEGEVIRLFPQCEMSKDIVALWPGGRKMPARVRVLMQFLERDFSQHSCLKTPTYSPLQGRSD